MRLEVSVRRGPCVGTPTSHNCMERNSFWLTMVRLPQLRWLSLRQSTNVARRPALALSRPTWNWSATTIDNPRIGLVLSNGCSWETAGGGEGASPGTGKHIRAADGPAMGWPICFPARRETSGGSGWHGCERVVEVRAWGTAVADPAIASIGDIDTALVVLR